MSWSYDVTKIATVPLYQVRDLIGDTIVADQQLADEEIAQAMTVRANIFGAAADCARKVAARYARRYDTVVSQGGGGQLQNKLSQQAAQYRQMANEFDAKAAMAGSGTPYAGGISVSDKELAESNSDRVAPQFNVGMMDNYIPVGPLGNEVASDAPTDPD